MGLSPGSSITGFGPGVTTGETHIGDDAVVQAKSDAAAAYKNLAGLTYTKSLQGTDLGGLTLKSGVYNYASSGGLTGTLTLDAQGNSNAVFVFQFGSTITTASYSNVTIINGGKACNVYWQVGSSATLGTYSALAGNFIALASITATTGVSVNGGLYALNAAVTLDTNNLNAQGTCNGNLLARSLSTPQISNTISNTFITATRSSTSSSAAAPRN